MVLALDPSVSIREVRDKSPIDCFAWQRAFCARLACRRAPTTPAQLFDLAQAVHAFRGHLDPIAVADEILRTWPFDVTHWGGLH
jgi:hypothetical protein